MHSTTPVVVVIIIVVVVFSPGVATTVKKCSFPVEWRGRYYQTGLKEVVIRENVITTKGTCIEQNNRDYFLFYNRESQCYNCLLIMRQHRNIIQYKESFCTSIANMSIVCNHIRVETTLYTMVKEPVVSGVKCPFQDRFNFTYNDMGSEFCTQMESYAKPCVSQTRYQLHFRHCTGSAEYHEKEVNLECLATWKDGSEMYLYGRLSGTGLTTKDERYRCFKYHHYGSEMSIAMSADTSCRGLRSATDGPFLMKFSKDSLGSLSSSSCRFPDWLAGVTWRSLDARHQYTLESSDQATLLESFRSSTGHLQRINEYRCHQQLTDGRKGGGDDDDDDDVILISYTTHKCSSRHQCIKIKKIANRVIEIFQGPWLEAPGAYDLCRSHVYEDGHLLIPEDPVAAALSVCPRPGVYSLMATDTCSPRRLDVGCSSNESTIDGQDRCQGPLSMLNLQCLFTWNRDSKTFVITKSKESGTINCFSFSRDMSDTEWFGIDFSCSRNQTTVLGSWSKQFRLQKQGNCQNAEVSTRQVVIEDLRRTEKHPFPLPTQNPDKELNLFADAVQPRRRSKTPPILVEDDEDEDEIFSGSIDDNDHNSDRKSQRAPPPEPHPVTWRKSFPVSTPTFVFQISSSPRRINNAKLGPKGQPNSRGHSEGQEGRPNRGRGGEQRVEASDESGCGRTKAIESVIVLISIIVAGLTRFF